MCSLMKLDAVGNRVDTDGVKLYCGDMAKVGFCAASQRSK